MKINVLWSHINEGKPDKACECPVARALRDAGFPFAVVGSETIWLEDIGGTKFLRKDLPEVDKFIKQFDAGELVEPFSFFLEVK